MLDDNSRKLLSVLWTFILGSVKRQYNGEDGIAPMKPNRLDPLSNKMWSSSRMMLPEHVLAIQTIKTLEENNMTKGPKRPTRDEYQLEELGERLVEAQQEETELLFTVWNWEQKARGRIVTMDSRSKTIHVSNHDEIIKIPFLDIMKVESPVY